MALPVRRATPVAALALAALLAAFAAMPASRAATAANGATNGVTNGATNGASIGKAAKLCRSPGALCSFYKNDTCCGRLLCTVPTDCGVGGGLDGCLPVCRNQTVGEFEKIQFPLDVGTAPGFEVGPKTQPAVIVVQEWWGANSAILATARQIAEQGYRVLVPDLYRGDIALEVTQALRLRGELDWNEGIKDVQYAAKYLKSTGSPKVAIVGFCMGGTMAFCGAQYADVDAAIVFYGLVEDHIPCDPLKIPTSVPVQVQFGGDDSITTVAAVKPVVRAMREEGIDAQLYVYPGLPHAYLNAITPEGRQLRIVMGQDFRTANETLVTLSFARMISFLRQHIGS